MKHVPIPAKPRTPQVADSADDWIASRRETPQIEIEKEPTKRLTFDIPVSLHRKIKLPCVERDVTFAKLIRSLLVESYG